MKGHYSHGTNHLRKHMDKCVRKYQPDIQNVILQGNISGGLSIYNRDTFDRNVAKEKMAKAIIMHELPLSYVEWVGIRDYNDYLNPLVGHFSRNTIKAECIRIHDVERIKTMKMLESIESKVAITTDTWTSNTKKGYMVVTVHYIDNHWKLHNRIIRYNHNLLDFQLYIMLILYYIY